MTALEAMKIISGYIDMLQIALFADELNEIEKAEQVIYSFIESKEG